MKVNEQRIDALTDVIHTTILDYIRQHEVNGSEIILALAKTIYVLVEQKSKKD